MHLVAGGEPQAHDMPVADRGARLSGGEGRPC